MLTLKRMTALHFDLFRTAIGLATTVLFSLVLLKWKDAFLYTPWIFWVILLGIGSSFLFAINIQRKLTAIITIAVMITINRMNPFSIKVVHGYISWILFASLFIPAGEGTRILGKKADGQWQMPELVQLAIVIVLSFSLTFAGLTKVFTPLWYSGEAMDLFMRNPRFNWELAPVLSKIPGFGPLATHAVWIGEVLFMPFYFYPRTRRATWIAGMVLTFLFFSLMHIYIVAFILLIILSFLYPGKSE